jgi:hypothetical protein
MFRPEWVPRSWVASQRLNDSSDWLMATNVSLSDRAALEAKQKQVALGHLISERLREASKSVAGYSHLSSYSTMMRSKPDVSNGVTKVPHARQSRQGIMVSEELWLRARLTETCPLLTQTVGIRDDTQPTTRRDKRSLLYIHSECSGNHLLTQVRASLPPLHTDTDPRH